MAGTIPEDLHVQLGVSEDRLTTTLSAAVASLATQRFYVFRIPPGAASGANAPAKPRTIPAFLSPDDAITFAQRHSARGEVRIRSISATTLLRTMLATPSIGRVVFLQAVSIDPTIRSFPPGMAVTRDRLLALLQAEKDEIKDEINRQDAKNEMNRKDTKDAKNEEN